MTNALANSTNQIVDPDDIQLGEDILGIRGPVEIPTGWEWLLYTLIALSVVALTIFLVKRLLKRAAVIRMTPLARIAAASSAMTSPWIPKLGGPQTAIETPISAAAEVMASER